MYNRNPFLLKAFIRIKILPKVFGYYICISWKLYTKFIFFFFLSLFQRCYRQGLWNFLDRNYSKNSSTPKLRTLKSLFSIAKGDFFYLNLVKYFKYRHVWKIKLKKDNFVKKGSNKIFYDRWKMNKNTTYKFLFDLFI